MVFFANQTTKNNQSILRTVFIGMILSIPLSALITLQLYPDNLEIKEVITKQDPSVTNSGIIRGENKTVISEDNLPLGNPNSETRRQLATIHNIKEHSKDSGAVPMIYTITPTYSRVLQIPELTRVSQTFLHVKNFHWIVVEDSGNQTSTINDFLANSGLNYTHINIKATVKEKGKSKSRGVLQRNLGLDWIRKNVDPKKEGVVYFADDDNTYDLRLFEEMRYTKQASIWPVGFVGGALEEGPVCQNGSVTGWKVKWGPARKFPIDMAGFALNLYKLFEHPDAKFSYKSKAGYLESDFLSSVTTVKELEPKADMCTKVLVWHTQTVWPSIQNNNKSRSTLKRSKTSLKSSQSTIKGITSHSKTLKTRIQSLSKATEENTPFQNQHNTTGFELPQFQGIKSYGMPTRPRLRMHVLKGFLGKGQI